MIISVVYLLVRCLLGCVIVLSRGRLSNTCPPEPVDLAEYRIHRKQVLSGLTHEYYIAA